MNLKRSLAAVLLPAALACGGPPEDDGSLGIDASDATVRTPWVFTRVPATWASHTISSPAIGLEAFAFEVSTSTTKLTRLTRIDFFVTGSLAPGDVVNYQVLYFPGGFRRSSGVVVGTSSGSSWTFGPVTGTIRIPLTTPIDLTNRFRGAFALRVDVVGAGPFFFSTQLQSAMIDVAGRAMTLDGLNCDLPINGDEFSVR